MKSNRGLLPQVGIATPRTCHAEHESSKGETRTQATTMLALAAVGLLLGSSPLYSQSTFGSVRGIVQDNTNASVPGTTVILHSTDENTDRTLPADATGDFDFENVKAGNYTVRAHHDGFADTVISAVALQ